ncbi:oligosaccharyl transferase, STT3 subunit [Pyrococcus kukulkanii]|uniref:oligosaccharyl transferase, STT3 subunit n=1 Tax=Pyrococcus kukulkanii TaxID=1609559 RepID=UPI0035637369
MRKFNFERIFEPKVALPLITLIATLFRLVPLRYKYLFGYDPYFHLTYIEESLKAGYWINFYHLANAPWGVLMERSWHPLGFYATPVYIWKFLKIFGVSLYDAFRITPVIFGVLTIIFFYLAMLNFYGKKEAFFSAFFLAVMFGHVFRSMANYYRGDNYMLFWYSVALFGVSLALKKTRRVWRCKRFAFYLIPAFASGVASIFWGAYYPIFVFLLGNAVFLAIGAFISEKKEYFKDATALTISTVFGALIANYLGKKFRYGTLGYNKWLGKKLVGMLNIESNYINDAYLLLHIKYLVPLALMLILFAFVITKKVVKNKKIRFFVFISVLILGSVLLFNKLELVLYAFERIGYFVEKPVLETRRPTINDLFVAFGVTIFLVPFYILRFRNFKVVDFMMLGMIFPTLFMLSFWTRFLFIASMAVSFMSGVGLVSFYEAVKSKVNGRKALTLSLCLLVLIPGISAVLGLERTYKEKPLINDYWVRALIWLKGNTNENDVVLAWWDYGAWIEYYARRRTVAQMYPHKNVARYLVGNLSDKWLMSLGVDYVIVSYDTVLKFGAILDTANVSKEGYFLIILPLVSKVGVLVFQQEQYTIIARPGERWNILINTGTAAFSPKEAFLEYKNSIIKLNIMAKNTADAYVYLNLNYDYAVLMSEKTFNTTLAKLLFTDEYPKSYQIVYSDGGYIKIFKFNYSSSIE